MYQAKGFNTWWWVLQTGHAMWLRVTQPPPGSSPAHPAGNESGFQEDKKVKVMGQESFLHREQAAPGQDGDRDGGSQAMLR